MTDTATTSQAEDMAALDPYADDPQFDSDFYEDN